MATAADVIKLMEESGSKWLDLRFTDVPGTWQHVSFPKHEVTEDLFAEGTGFDGSSIRGFQTIDESGHAPVPRRRYCNRRPVHTGHCVDHRRR